MRLAALRPVGNSLTRPSRAIEYLTSQAGEPQREFRYPATITNRKPVEYLLLFISAANELDTAASPAGYRLEVKFQQLQAEATFKGGSLSPHRDFNTGSK